MSADRAIAIAPIGRLDDRDRDEEPLVLSPPLLIPLSSGTRALVRSPPLHGDDSPMRLARHHAIFLGLLIAGCSTREPPSTSTSTSTGTTGSGGQDGGTKGSLLVKTDKGTVEGILDGSTRAFLGVPYAASPTGALRWKAPAPHEAWTE